MAAVAVKPGRISNREDILDASGELKPGLQMPEDYDILPRNVWELLHSWYGGGPPVARFVIEEGADQSKLLRVEVYLLRIRIWVCDAKTNELSESRVAHYSKNDRLKEVLQKECGRLGWDAGKTRIFTMDDAPNDALTKEALLDPALTLDDAMIGEGQRIFFQTQGPKHVWPPLPSDKQGAAAASGTTNKKRGWLASLFGGTKPDSASPGGKGEEETTTAVLTPASVVKRSADGGLCGLHNLGNTCFMNSALQALLHTDPLVDYFLSGMHSKEINRKNPLGMKGQLANAFADLVRDVWRASRSSVENPKQLKYLIGKFAPQFSGYQQQDAHELLAFLLDGIHEDLNRVLVKPYIEHKDVEGASTMTDAELAPHFWRWHELRNRSVVVDLFHAQLKSTLQCPSPAEGGCSRVSVTFDPSAYLTLPFPSWDTQQRQFVEIAVARDPILQDGCWNADMAIKYSVEVEARFTIGQMLDRLHKQVEDDPLQRAGKKEKKRLILSDHYSGRVQGFRRSEDAIMTISRRELQWAYYVPVNAGAHEYVQVGCSHQKPRSSPTLSGADSLGLPFLISLPLKCTTVLDVYLTAWRAISCYFKLSQWEPVGNPMFFDEPGDILDNSQVRLEANPPVDKMVPLGAWRVHRGEWERDDEKKGLWYLQVQVLSNKKFVSAFPFRIRWGVDLRLGVCSWCKKSACPGCELGCEPPLQEQDEKQTRIQHEGRLVALERIKGMPQLVLFWEDAVAREKVFDEKLAVNVRLNANVKPNRALAASLLNQKQQPVSLYDCLGQFQINEHLDKQNLWYCPWCKDHRQAWKKMEVYSLPTILVIHLKRFRANGPYRQKIGQAVSFPLQGLDMSPYAKASREGGWIYDCFAVVNHSGDLGGGHYTAFAKKDGSWYLFNDSSVRSVEAASVVSSAAYIMFYALQSNKTTPTIIEGKL